MSEKIKIGIIGDYSKNTISQPAIDAALEHSAAASSIDYESAWLPTGSFLAPEGCGKLNDFDAFWISSGDPQNIEGAITGIRIARETGKPFFGT